MNVELTEASLRTAGILLVSIVGIEYGGTFLLRVVQGKVPATDFQKSFFRAGHAHAGVLVILALICTILVGATDLTGAWEWVARSGVAAGAILVPAGFFFAPLGRGRETPNRWIVLVYLGAALVAAGVLTLGLALLTA